MMVSHDTTATSLAIGCICTPCSPTSIHADYYPFPEQEVNDDQEEDKKMPIGKQSHSHKFGGVGRKHYQK